MEFLLYARTHIIIALCYPSHTTHIYQGLDVVIFSQLKQALSDKQDKLLYSKGIAIDKSNFLEIYANAHICALTKENILTAFHKTGAVPFNPKVTTDDMLASSKETSYEGHLPLPSTNPTVKALSQLLQKLSVEPITDNNQNVDGTTEIISDGSIRSQIQIGTIQATLKELTETNHSHLFTFSTIITSDTPMPSSSTQPLSHISSSSPLLSLTPTTVMETALLVALRESEHQNQLLCAHVIELQAINILNETYCSKIKSQLAPKETKEADKGKGKLVGDGLPKLLTDDEFWEHVIEHNAEKERKAKIEEERASAKQAYIAAVEAWTLQEATRKQEKEMKMIKHKELVVAWEKTKKAGGKAAGLKPKLPTFPRAEPKPLLRDFQSNVVDNRDVSESSNGPQDDE